MIGFYLLIGLMFLVTIGDFFKFRDKLAVVWEKLNGLF